MKDSSQMIRELAEKYGIVDEGNIVEMTDLEGREEIPAEDGDGENPS